MSDNLLTDILQHVDVLQIMGEYVSLRQVGRTVKALCPFHVEKTPSFHVNPERGLWHCFGCNAGGNLIQFVMKIENLSFREAREILARKAGIQLNPAFEAQEKKQGQLRKILEQALFFYRQVLLKGHAGEEGLKYLERRGIEGKTVENFQLGMAPSSGRSLLEHLSSHNFHMEEIKEAGLVTRLEPSRDYFHRRIIFPIWSPGGNLIGFGGRTIGHDEPKYLNSPESHLFKKGENLYALHFAKPAITREKFAVLAEGYMDVLMLHQYGFDQAVASLGTSLTPSQAKLLSRHAPRILVSYDGDNAGIEAMRRAMGILQGAGLELSLLSLPQGEDPDSFLRKEGAAAFKELIQQAMSPVDYAFKAALSGHDRTSPEGKQKIANQMIPVLRALQDPILRDEYVKKITQELEISESVVRRLLHGKTGSGKTEIEEKDLSSSREKEILRWLLWEPALAPTIWSSLSVEDFDEEESRLAAEALCRLWKEEKGNMCDLEDISEATLLLLSRLSNQPPVGTVEVVEALLQAQKERNLKKEVEMLKQQVSRLLKEGKLHPTDEAYKSYISLLKKTKGEGAAT